MKTNVSSGNAIYARNFEKTIHMGHVLFVNQCLSPLTF